MEELTEALGVPVTALLGVVEMRELILPLLMLMILGGCAGGLASSGPPIEEPPPLCVDRFSGYVPRECR